MHSVHKSQAVVQGPGTLITSFTANSAEVSLVVKHTISCNSTSEFDAAISKDTTEVNKEDRGKEKAQREVRDQLKSTVAVAVTTTMTITVPRMLLMMDVVVVDDDDESDEDVKLQLFRFETEE